MKTRSILFFSFLFFIFSNIVAQQSSGSDFAISLSRDFGYGGSGEIQGTFSIHAKTIPASAQRVEFFIDKNKIGEDTQAPFALQFSTDSFAAGSHTISAIAYLSDNSSLVSNLITTRFVSADAVPGKVLGLVGPLLGIIFGVVALGFVVPMIFERRRGKVPLGAQRNYGMMGGAICPKCHRPFSIHVFKLNMGLSSLDRCPHCGKWSLIRRASLDELRAAEAAELRSDENNTNINGVSEEEKLKKELDDSRFSNT